MIVIIELRFWALPHNNISYIGENSFSPPIRHTIHHRHILMPREPQINKPFLVQPLGCFLQQFDLALVGFDETNY